MAIITITSDWKEGDYYLGALKGALFSLRSGIDIVEITNAIPSFDVLQEVFILKNSFRHFPKESIHLMGVMSEPSQEAPMVVIYAEGHYFIGVNDGRFSLLFDNPPSICFEIEKDKSMPYSTFSALEFFKEGVDIILSNTFESRTRASRIKTEVISGVVYNEESIVGRVIYIDSFGNIITNIEKRLFDTIQQGRRYIIFIQGPYTKLEQISYDYRDVAPGKMVALFNSLGLLEIAMNQSNLSELEGLTLSTEVRIKFEK